MLPSGNDAALALAENFGNILIKQKNGFRKRVMKFEDSIKIVYEHKSNPVKAFVREMNKYCIKYKLKDT